MKLNWLRADTFAQRWRVAMMVLLLGSGIVAAGGAAWLVTIISSGVWSAAVEGARVSALANALYGSLALMGAAMVGILVAGPLSKITATVGGNTLDVCGDEEK